MWKLELLAYEEYVPRPPAPLSAARVPYLCPVKELIAIRISSGLLRETAEQFLAAIDYSVAVAVEEQEGVIRTHF